jgi:hypothetical protein
MANRRIKTRAEALAALHDALDLVKAVQAATLRGPVALSLPAGSVQALAEARAALDVAAGHVEATRGIEAHVVPYVDAEGVCEACEKMPEGRDGRANFCAYHRVHPTVPTAQRP